MNAGAREGLRDGGRKLREKRFFLLACLLARLFVGGKNRFLQSQFISRILVFLLLLCVSTQLSNCLIMMKKKIFRLLLKMSAVSTGDLLSHYEVVILK
jgi:hypothetical protein